MHTQTCDLGDLRLTYRDNGASQDETSGPALVLAHAMTFDLTMWDAVVALLPPGLRVIRYDARGHGGSSAPPGPWSMGALVRDAERLLDHLGVRDCVFVGCAMGGMVAQGLAVKRMDQVRALVLSNTAARIGTAQTWKALMDNVRATGLAARIDADMANLFSPACLATAEAATWRAHLLQADPDVWLRCCGAISGTDFFTTTAALRLPTLAIASDRDRITPPDLVRETADLVAGRQFALIRGAGHLPPIEAPAAFAVLLVRFLESIGHLGNFTNQTFLRVDAG